VCFLDCSDDELADMALDVVLALTDAAKLHRCMFTEDENYLTSALHPLLLTSLCNIIYAADIFCSVSVQEFMSDDFSVENSGVMRQTPRFEPMKIGNAAPVGRQEIDYFSADIGEEYTGKNTPIRYWRLRFLSNLGSIVSRIGVLYSVYRALIGIIVYNSRTDRTLDFLKNRSYLIKGLLYILDIGDRVHSYPGKIKSLRRLSCVALSAMLFMINSDMDRESVDQFFLNQEWKWITKEIGCEKGDYVGLLPSMVRSELSYFVTCENFDDSSVERLLWIEDVLLLLLGVMSTPSGPRVFIDNGIVTLILSVLKNPLDKDKTALSVYIYSLLTAILAQLVESKHLACEIFIDENGLDVIIDCLKTQFAFIDCCPAQSLIANQIFALELLQFFGIHISSGKDSRCSQLLRSDEYCELLHVMTSKAIALELPVLSELVHCTKNIINSDPAMPTLLNHFLSSLHINDLLSIIKSVFERKEGIYPEFFIDVIELLSAISISASGIELLTISNPFPALLSSFHNPKNVNFPDTDFLISHSINIGEKFEELLRYYPVYTDLLVDAFIREIEEICRVGRSFTPDGAAGESSCRFECFLIFIRSICSTLDCLLINRPIMRTKFIEKKGFGVLAQLLDLSRRPPAYCLVSLVCPYQKYGNFDTTDDLLHMPTDSSVYESIDAIADSSPEESFGFLVKELGFIYQQIDGIIGSLSEILGSDAGCTSFEKTTSGSLLPVSFFDYFGSEQLFEVDETYFSSKKVHYLTEILVLFVKMTHYVTSLSGIIPLISEKKSLQAQLIQQDNLEIMHKILCPFLDNCIQVILNPNNYVTDGSRFLTTNLAYVILITAVNCVHVYSEPRFSSKKVTRLQPGSLCDAFDIIFSIENDAQDHTIFFRIESGWVCVFDKHSIYQLEVISIRLLSTKERSLHHKKIQPPEGEPRFVETSPRQAGINSIRNLVLSLIHLNNCLLESFRSSVDEEPNNNFPRDQLYTSINWVISRLCPVQSFKGNNIDSAFIESNDRLLSCAPLVDPTNFSIVDCVRIKYLINFVEKFILSSPHTDCKVLEVFFSGNVFQTMAISTVMLLRSEINLHRDISTESTRNAGALDSTQVDVQHRAQCNSLLKCAEVSNIFDFWNQFLRKLSRLSKNLEEIHAKIIFDVVGILWELFYYDDLLYVPHIVKDLTVLAKTCIRATDGFSPKSLSVPKPDGIALELQSALIDLGCSLSDIRHAIKVLPKSSHTVESILNYIFDNQTSQNQDFLSPGASISKQLLDMGFSSADIAKVQTRIQQNESIDEILTAIVSANDSQVIQGGVLDMSRFVKSKRNSTKGRSDKKRIKPSKKVEVDSSQKASDDFRQRFENLHTKLCTIEIKMAANIFSKCLPKFKELRADFFEVLNGMSFKEKFRLSFFLFVMLRDNLSKGLPETSSIMNALIQIFNSNTSIRDRQDLVLVCNFHNFFKDTLELALRSAETHIGYLNKSENSLALDDIDNFLGNFLLLADYVFLPTFILNSTRGKNIECLHEEISLHCRTYITDTDIEFLSCGTYFSFDDILKEQMSFEHEIEAKTIGDLNAISMTAIRRIYERYMISSENYFCTKTLSSALQIIVHLPKSLNSYDTIENVDNLVTWLLEIGLASKISPQLIVSVCQSFSFSENIQYHMTRTLQALPPPGSVKANDLSKLAAYLPLVSSIIHCDTSCFMTNFYGGIQKHPSKNNITVNSFSSESLEVEQLIFSWIMSYFASDQKALGLKDELLSLLLRMICDAVLCLPRIVYLMCYNEGDKFISILIKNIFETIILSECTLTGSVDTSKSPKKKTKISLIFILITLCMSATDAHEMVMIEIKNLLQKCCTEASPLNKSQTEIVFAVSSFICSLNDIHSDWLTFCPFAICPQLLLSGAGIFGIHLILMKIISKIDKSIPGAVDLYTQVFRAISLIIFEGGPYARNCDHFFNISSTPEEGKPTEIARTPNLPDSVNVDTLESVSSVFGIRAESADDSIDVGLTSPDIVFPRIDMISLRAVYMDYRVSTVDNKFSVLRDDLDFAIKTNAPTVDASDSSKNAWKCVGFSGADVEHRYEADDYDGPDPSVTYDEDDESDEYDDGDDDDGDSDDISDGNNADHGERNEDVPGSQHQSGLSYNQQNHNFSWRRRDDNEDDDDNDDDDDDEDDDDEDDEDEDDGYGDEEEDESDMTVSDQGSNVAEDVDEKLLEIGNKMCRNFMDDMSKKSEPSNRAHFVHPLVFNRYIEDQKEDWFRQYNTAVIDHHRTDLKCKHLLHPRFHGQDIGIFLPHLDEADSRSLVYNDRFCIFRKGRICSLETLGSLSVNSSAHLQEDVIERLSSMTIEKSVTAKHMSSEDGSTDFSEEYLSFIFSNIYIITDDSIPLLASADVLLRSMPSRKPLFEFSKKLFCFTIIAILKNDKLLFERHGLLCLRQKLPEEKYSSEFSFGQKNVSYYAVQKSLCVITKVLAKIFDDTAQDNISEIQNILADDLFFTSLLSLFFLPCIQSYHQQIYVSASIFRILKLVNKCRIGLSLVVLDHIDIPVINKDLLVALSNSCVDISRHRDKSIHYMCKIVNILSSRETNRVVLISRLQEVLSGSIEIVLNEVVKIKEIIHSELSKLDVKATIPKTVSEKAQYLMDFSAISMSLMPMMNILRLLSAAKDHMSKSEVRWMSSYISDQESLLRLWDSLIESLDIIRKFRRFGDEKDSEKAHSLNSIEVQFVPLVKCFMEICTMTLIESKDKSKLNTSIESVDTPIELGRNPSTDSAIGAGEWQTSIPIQRVVSAIEQHRRRMEERNFYIRKQLHDSPLALRLMKFAEDNSLLINAVLRQNIKLLKQSLLPMLVVPSCRRHLDFKVKRAYLRFQLKNLASIDEDQDNDDEEYDDDDDDCLNLEIDRRCILQSTFESMHTMKEPRLRKPTNIQFLDEEGVDGGGLTKEWYHLLTRDIFSPQFNLFQSLNVNNPTYQPSASSSINPRHLEYFTFVGKIVAKAICDGELLDVHFSRSFYQHILGLPVSFQDLEAVDGELYKSLKLLLENNIEDLGIEITFSTDVNDFGSVQIIDLKENGRNITVTDENSKYILLNKHISL